MVENKFNFALKVQMIESTTDRVLVVLYSCGVLNGNGWAKKGDVDSLFNSLRIPLPSNTSQYLKLLKERSSVIYDSKNKFYSVTPMGVVNIRSLMGNLDVENLHLNSESIKGSDFGHAVHSTIPPEYAPLKWQNGINSFLERYPFESNVFLITRFPIDESDTNYLDPISNVIDVIRNVLSKYGLTLHLASDRQIDDDLLGNIAAHMWACKYGVGILEDRLGRGLNHNVVTEIGAMLMTGRRCALLKDLTSPALPTDIIGQIYKPVDLDELLSVKKLVENWVIEDLGIS